MVFQEDSKIPSLNHITSLLTAVSFTVSALKQLTMDSGIRYAAFDLVNVLSFMPIRQKAQKQLRFTWDE